MKAWIIINKYSCMPATSRVYIKKERAEKDCTSNDSLCQMYISVYDLKVLNIKQPEDEKEKGS